MRVNKQPWEFATPQEENRYLQAEVERLREQVKVEHAWAEDYKGQRDAVQAELEFVRSERDRLRDAVEILRVELEKR